ncbi:MAG: rod shape-determining protein MreD [Alicyclobacillus sp.]|nr:rod shape-determining protein MreD [Alicyclobacillus sp.]
MRNVIAFVLLWLALIIQSTVFQIPPLRFVQPDWVLVVLMVAALTRGSRAALVLGAAVGFIQDANYGSFLGLNAFVYGAVGYFAAAWFDQFLHRNIALTFMVTLCFTFLYEWVTYGLTRLFGVAGGAWHTLMLTTVQQMILNGMALLLLYTPLTRLLSDKPRRRYAEQEEGAGS